jgi:hypothetical protein
MRRISLCLMIAVLGASALGASQAAAAPKSMTVVTHGAFVTRIGTFRPSENPSMSAAIRAFGPPTSRSGSGTACRALWRGLQLRILFVNLGAPGQSACTPSIGNAQSFSVRSPRFQTVRGLRPGAPAAEITTRHPGAKYQVGAWTLVSAVSPYGDGTRTPVLQAFASAGKVTILKGWIGGAGE